MSQLQTTLRQLRLSGRSQTLDVRLQEAAAGRLGHGEFLELILQDELNVRHQRQAADFRALKSLEDFDWQFNPSIRRSQIFELAAGNYLREGRDIALTASELRPCLRCQPIMFVSNRAPLSGRRAWFPSFRGCQRPRPVQTPCLGFEPEPRGCSRARAA